MMCTEKKFFPSENLIRVRNGRNSITVRFFSTDAIQKKVFDSPGLVRGETRFGE